MLTLALILTDPDPDCKPGVSVLQVKDPKLKGPSINRSNCVLLNWA